MRKYIIKRLLQLIPILFGITLLTFVLMHTSSVDAVDMMEQNTGMAWTEEQKTAIREELGLDKSVPVQYLNWVGNMLKGDMGTSYISGQPVLQMFLTRLPMTGNQPSFSENTYISNNATKNPGIEFPIKLKIRIK